jgi:hypothetical protein
LHLILGYLLMSVIWLIYVYSKKNKLNQQQWTCFKQWWVCTLMSF